MSINESRDERAPLNMPPAPAVRYARNFIRQAVCELRFPTLYDLEDARPPASFASALRKDYPNQQLVKSVNVGIGTPSQANVHAFNSKKNYWTVNLKVSSVSLETTKYENFEDFKQRLAKLIDAAKPVIDSDFFTRVGLRYINELPYKRDEIDRWINPSLVGSLTAGIYGDAVEHVGRISGVTESGNFTLQHGVNTTDGSLKLKYTLDFDLSSEDVLLSDTLAMVQKLHDLEISMFAWALGPAAKSYLGPSLI